MIPQDDWMVLKLWEKQADALSIKLALPDSVDRVSDPAAVFEIVKLGPLVHEHKKVVVGDIVIMCGLGAVAKIQLPNGKNAIAGRLQDVAYVVEKEDLYGD